MAFRTSVPQEELRESVPAEQLDPHATTYQSSRGGYFPEADRPVPGTPQGQQGD